MVRSPTVYDVAERAGVSIATVSFAFGQPERVKNSTREAVLAAADALGYVPSGSARGLARGRTGALGLFSFDYLMEASDSPAESAEQPAGNGRAGEDPNDDFRLFPLYLDEVQRGFELECWRRGYALLIGGGNRFSSRAVVADIAGRVDGLAVFPGTVPDEVMQRISRRIPVVELSEPSHAGGTSHVTVGNAAGMQSLTEHLITTHGYRDFLFVGPLVNSDNEARFSGFADTLMAAGIPVPAQPREPDGAFSAARFVREVLDRGPLPDAFVCATDPEALAVLDALAELGIRVPEEVAVTGFDGIVAGRIVRPSLTTVRQPMEQMGRAAADILIERLSDPEKPAVNRQLPVSLLVRESCGCPPR